MATKKTTKKATTTTAIEALAELVKPVKRRTAKDKFVNNTSRLRKWVCDCTTHIVDEETGKEMPGPYIIRVAGTGLLTKCEYCHTIFVLEDLKAQRRLYRGCQHCTDPAAHEHGKVEEVEA